MIRMKGLIINYWEYENFTYMSTLTPYEVSNSNWICNAPESRLFEVTVKLQSLVESNFKPDIIELVKLYFVRKNLKIIIIVPSVKIQWKTFLLFYP